MSRWLSDHVSSYHRPQLRNDPSKEWCPDHPIPCHPNQPSSCPILSNQPTNQPSSSQSSFLSSQPPQPSPVSPLYRCRFTATTGPHQWKNCLHSQHPRAIPPDYRIEASQDDTSIELSFRMSFFTSDRTCKSNVFQLPRVFYGRGIVDHQFIWRISPFFTGFSKITGGFSRRTSEPSTSYLMEIMGNPGIYETLRGNVAFQAVNSHDPMLELDALCLTPLYLRNYESLTFVQL